MSLENLDSLYDLIDFSEEEILEDPESETIIMELEEDFEIPNMDSSNSKIPCIKFKDDKAKNYVIFRMVPGLDSRDRIVSIDFAYGNVDFDTLRENPEYLDRFFKYIVSRKGLDGIVRKRLGLLPEDVNVLDNCSEDWFPRENDYIFDRETINVVFEGVLKASHREEVENPNAEKKEETENPSVEEENSQEEEQEIEKKGFLETFKELNRGNAPKQKRRTIKEKLDDLDRQKTSGENSEHVKEADLDKTGSNLLAVFYKTGMVIKRSRVLEEDGTFDGDFKTTVTPRYNFCLREMSTHKLSYVQSILIDGADEKKFETSSECRTKFVKDICIPLLESPEYDIVNGLIFEDNSGELNNVWPYDGTFSKILGKTWPYIGIFNENEKNFSIVSNIEERKYFSKLSNDSQERDRDE